MREKKVVYAPIFVSVIMILLLISENIIHTAVSNGADYYLAFTVVQLIVYMLPMAFYSKVRNLMFFKALKFNFFSYRYLLLIICLALMFVCGILLVLFADLYYFGGDLIAANVNPYVFASVGEQIYVVLGLVIVPATVKELLFRGIVLSEYRSYGASWAIVMSTLLFAVSSMSYSEFPTLIYVGLFFGIIGAVTDSVIPSVVLHIIYNAFSIYAKYPLVNYMKKISDSAMPLFVLGIILLLLIFLSFSVLESIYRKKAADCDDDNEVIKKISALEKNATPREANKPKRSFLQNAAELLLSPAFLCTAAIFIITAAINRT